MFLRELAIRNIRSLRDVKLSFEVPEEGTRRWTMIHGENGSGKSTLLRAIGLLLAGSDALPHLIGSEIESWIRYTADDASISARLVTAEDQERRIELKLHRGMTTSKLYELNRETLLQLDEALSHATQNYLTVGYGASRRLNSNVDSAFKSRHQTPIRARSVATLFSPEAVLDPLEAWAMDMDYQGKAKSGRKWIDALVKELLPHVDFYKIDRQKKQLLFKTPDGITPLSRLSDGYQNVIAWCGDLLRCITDAFPKYKNPLEARGLLLVDEIDLHLHPVWQRQLREYLSRTFPKLQFVVTTHSPLTVQQAAEGELFVMRRTRANASPRLDPFEGAPNTMMIHQLLMSPVFGLATMDSRAVEKKRQKFKELQKKSGRTADESERLKELRSSLQELPDMSSGINRYERSRLKVLKEIQSALESDRNSQ